MEKNADTDLIEIPSDLITVDVDADGTPMAVPTDKAKGGGVEAKPKVTVTLAELHAQQAIADAAAKRAADLEASIAAKDAKLAETEKKLGKTEGIAINAHYAKTHSDYVRAADAVQQYKSQIANTENYANAKIREAAAFSEAGEHLKAEQARAEVARLEAERVQLASYSYAAEQQLLNAKYHYETAAAAASPTAPVKEEPKVVETKPEPTKAAPTPEQWIESCPTATQPWLKEHKEFATDRKQNRALLRFVDKYLADHDDNQAALNTPDFVRALDEEFFPDSEGAMSEEPEVIVAKVEPKPKAKTTPAAPVRGNSVAVFSSSNLNAKAIRLPPDVKAFCKASGLDETSYALGVVEDIRAGKLPKEWLDPGYDRGIR